MSFFSRLARKGKVVLCGALAAAGVLAGVSAASASVALPDLGISPTDYTSGLASGVSPWVAGAIGFGAALIIVILGWSLFTRLAKKH